MKVDFRTFPETVKSLLGRDQLIRGFGMLGIGEALIRLSRLFTAIVLARTLAPIELGIAATAITCFELIRILANNGLGQSVIRATDDELQATCNTAHRLIWLICIGMTALQISVGIVVASLAGNPDIALMVACLALVYLVMPPGMVHGWLLQRQHRMGAIAGISTAQTGADNFLSAALALIGFGAWSIVLPKLITAPIWLFGVRQAVEWKRDAAAGEIPVKGMLNYSVPILASEMLLAARNNVDKILVGAILGLEALGIYYFAFNAGYGLSLVLTGALTAASFPHFADARLSRAELIQRFDHAMARLALPICVVIALQAVAIFYYVPLLFGTRWSPYVTVVSVLCLSAVSKPFFDLACQLLRAAGEPKAELKASVIFTVVLLAGFSVTLPFGLLTGVATMAIISVVLQAIIAVWARRRIGQGSAPTEPANRLSIIKAGA